MIVPLWGGRGMKRVKISVIICFLFIMNIPAEGLQAESFDGREEEMNEKCSAIYDEETREQCVLYKEYLESRKQQTDQQITNIEQQIASVKGDIDKTVNLITSNEKEIAQYADEVKQLQASTEKMEASIQVLEVSIKEKIENIQERDAFLKERMVMTQPELSCNSMIDFLMGSSDFSDLLRRMAIVKELQAYEQEQIDKLAVEKEELSNQQSDQQIQKSILDSSLAQLTQKKEEAEKLKQANETLLASYREKAADLQEQKVKEQLASGSYASSIPNIDLTILPSDWGNGSEPSTPSVNQPSLSSGFIQPVQGNCYRSAGTWYYPPEFSGGIPLEHLGMDFGTYQQVGLPVVAPASGIVVAINDGVPNHPIGSNGVNSWTGYPAGGGNTLHMITSVNGTCYGISFYHLSPGMFNVNIGAVVSQGQTIAHTGHSGNTSGPHCHVEISNLGNISVEQGVQLFYRYGKDYFYGNYHVSGSCELKGSTPCLERPENFF